MTRRSRTEAHFLPVAVALALLSMLWIAGCADDPEPGASATANELLTWADARAEDDELAAATVGYRRALAADSLSIRAMVGLARVYDRQDRAEPADRYRRRAFHLRYHEGLAHLEAGAVDSARSALQAAVRIVPRHPLAHLRLGEIMRDAGMLDSAIVHFERAVDANPGYAESLIILGLAYEASQRQEDARNAYDRAVEANINAVDAYKGLGRIYSLRGEWGAAVSQFEKVLLIEPRSTEGRQGLELASSHLRQQN